MRKAIFRKNVRLAAMIGGISRGGPHSLDKKRPYFSYTLPGFWTAGFSMALSLQNAFWYRQRAGRNGGWLCWRASNRGITRPTVYHQVLDSAGPTMPAESFFVPARGGHRS